MKKIRSIFFKLVVALTALIATALPLLPAAAQDMCTLTVNIIGQGSVNPPGGTYESGTSINMTAEASGGWVFTGWGGAASGTGNPYSLTITDNITVTATFEEIPVTYSLNVNTVGSGSVTKNPDKTAYDSGEPVQLTANPVTGWAFSGWSGNISGTTNPATITMDGDKTITATFTQNTYTITTDNVGGGTITRSPDQASYHYGDIVQLTAAPGAGWTFSSWSGDLSGTTNPATITIDGNKAVTAAFTQNTYTITTDNVGGGTITRSPDQGSYHYGDLVQLTAAPGAGWSFTSWSGNFTGSQNPLAVTVSGNVSITATFSQEVYSLTVNTVGSGSVTRSPDQASYSYGITVQLTADPEDGWAFAGWSGNITGNTNPLTFTIQGPMNITATFTQEQYTLTINTIGNGSVARVPNQAAYIYGTTVQLSAIPTNDWAFAGWGGDINGHDNPKSFTVYQDTVVLASFRLSGNNGGGMGGNPSGDGGSSGGSTYYGPGTTQISPFINNSGIFMLDAAVKSDDGLVLLNIYEGVLAQTKDKTVLKAISIVPVDSPATAFAGSRLIGRTYELSPQGATFSPAVTLAIFYDQEALPDDIDPDSLSIMFFNPDTNVWEAVPSIHDKAESFVSGSIDHFSIFTLSAEKQASSVTTAPVAVEIPDYLAVSDLSVSPGSAAPGQKITISAKVTNSGTSSHEYTVTLKLNGIVEMIRNHVIAANSTVAVSFNVAKNDPGRYVVDVNGTTAAFTINEAPSNGSVTPTHRPPSAATLTPPAQRKNTNRWILAVFGLVFCLTVVMFIVINRRRK